MGRSVCKSVKEGTMAAGGKEQSNILPTDEEPIASLLDPSCEIPPDIQFEIFDEAGTLVGVLGGHKNLMALRSPVFKTMFFGAQWKEQGGDKVQIRDTSLVAFKALLKHIHDDKKEDDWQKIDNDIAEVAKIADIAERYHLPGLKAKTTGVIHRSLKNNVSINFNINVYEKILF